jgi:hypothetical protein
MNSHASITMTVRLLLVVWMASSSLAWAMEAEDAPVSGAMILPPAIDPGGIAPGAVEDTLKACLTRIPEDASVGQRMLAERGCQREVEIRQLLQAAPLF